MGYYTYYQLEGLKPKKNCPLTDEQVAEKLIEAFASLSYFEYEGDELRRCWESQKQNLQARDDWDWLVEASSVVNEILFSMDSLKWYDYEDDMIGISTDIPNVYLILYGDGEGSDDEWRSYYLNGIEVGKFYSVIPDQDMAAQVERELRPVAPTNTKNYLSNGGF